MTTAMAKNKLFSLRFLQLRTGPFSNKCIQHQLQRGCSSSANDCNSEAVKHDILEHSMNHVSTTGWTKQSIANGARDFGYSTSAQGLFPRGGTDLAFYFYNRSNKQLVDIMEAKLTAADDDGEETSAKIPTAQFLRDAVETRIRMTCEYQDNWPEAMALLSHPRAASESLQLLGQLVDDMWYLAGDRSHDMSWYTKRASLALIYKTTELFMLQDKSEDFEQTWQFLDRRFEDVGVVGSTISTVNDMALGFFNGGYQSVWTVMKNMSGVYPR